jgi:hypothetical protein
MTTNYKNIYSNMKTKLIILFSLVVLTISSQEILNISEEKLKSLYPENVFSIDYTTEEHIKYLYTTFEEDFYCYYLDSTNTVSRVMVIPKHREAYIPYLNNCNEKYKLVKTFYDLDIKKNDNLFKIWKGNLPIGGTARIRLFLEENEQHVYVYDTWIEQL